METITKDPGEGNFTGKKEIEVKMKPSEWIQLQADALARARGVGDADKYRAEAITMYLDLIN